MQTKSSYGVLKWALLASVAASLASACVVSSGDGNDDDTDITEGGDGNTSTGGKATGGGGSTSAGTNSSSGAPTSDAGEPAMGTGGAAPSTFVPGECQVDVDPITPTVEANCDADAADSDCIKCVKLQACSEYGTCFGTGPATACSVGQTEGAPGQFVCVSECFKAGAAAAVDADELLTDCASTCDECGSGGLNDETTALIAAANDAGTCQTECFPFE